MNMSALLPHNHAEVDTSDTSTRGVERLTDHASSVDPWHAFQTALVNNTPSCEGDDRFIDDLTRTTEVEGICHDCILFELCHDYASSSHPKAGIWAGRRWTRSARKDPR